ncbi:MAG: hypothetical protein RR620_08485 [Clostridium sp.]
MKKITLKQQIIDYYCQNSSKQDIKLSEIASLYNVKESYVSRCLKEHRKSDKKVLNENIKVLFYKENKNINDISEILDVSVPTVRKVLKSNVEEFNIEIERRKVESLNNRKAYKLEYNKIARLEKRREEEYIKNEMKRLQEIHARSMSVKSKMSDTSMVAYHGRHYNLKQTRGGNKVLVINNDMKHLISADMPRRLDITLH